MFTIDQCEFNFKMTKKQKLRRNGFATGFNAKEEGFMLADLDKDRGVDDPHPVPLQHFLDDEELIDSLLVNVDFNIHDGQKEEDGNTVDAKMLDDIDLTGDDAYFGKFVVGPIGLSAPHQPTNAAAVSDRYFETGFANQDAIDKLMEKTDFEVIDEMDQRGAAHDGVFFEDGCAVDGFAVDKFAKTARFIIEPVELQAEPAAALAANAAIMDGLDELPDDGEVTGQRLVDGGFNVLNARVDADGLDVFDPGDDEFVSGGEGGTGVHFAATRQATTSHPHSSVESLPPNDGAPNHLQGHKPTLFNEAGQNVKKTTLMAYAALGFAVAALLSVALMAVVVINMQAKVSKLTALVSILEEDMSGMAEKNADAGLDPVNGGSEASSVAPVSGRPITTPVDEPPHVHRPVAKDTKQPLGAVAKKVVTDKAQAPRRLLNPSHLATAAAKKPQATAAKKRISADNASVKLQPLRRVLAINKSPMTFINKSPAARKVTPVPDWSVKLTAYKDFSYAKNKAEKLQQKGVPVKVIAVNVNNARSYQLKVGGFQTKQKATAYAAKIKKSLNLGTLSVTDR